MSQPDLPDSDAVRPRTHAPPPPVLTGVKQDVPPPYTPNDWLMFALGVVLTVISSITGIVPVVLAVVFFVNKPPRSPILRGIGLGLAIVGVLWAGALTLCFVALGAASLQSGTRR